MTAEGRKTEDNRRRTTDDDEGQGGRSYVLTLLPCEG